jgi:hypothetical protein
MSSVNLRYYLLLGLLYIKCISVPQVYLLSKIQSLGKHFIKLVPFKLKF